MPYQNPFFQVQIEGADGNTWDNQVAITNAQFLRINSAKLSRNSLRAAKELELTLDNRGGTYNNILVRGQVADMWIGTTLDGSDRVQRFSGTLYKVEKNKKHGGIATLKVTFKDATFNLMNVLFTGEIVSGATRDSGGLAGYAATYTFNDYAEIIKWIMSFRRYNPQAIDAFTTTRVLTSGSTIRQNKAYHNIPVLQVLFELAAEANFNLYVDPSNNLHFEPKLIPSSTPSATVPVVRNLSELTDFEIINELNDSSMEKNRVAMYCGATTDGNRIFESHFVPDVSRQVKTIFRRNTAIAPSITGADAAERTSNARLACRMAAIAEYEKLKTKHDFRVEVFTYRDTEIGDFYTVTSTDLGYNPSDTLKLTEIEETFSPKDSYKAVYRLTTNLT